MKISSHLSYLVGIYLSDGALSWFRTKKGTKFVTGMRMDTKDKELALKTISTFQHVVPTKNKVSLLRNRGYYHINLYKRELGLFMESEDFNEVVRKHPKNFLQGLFDGDGHISWRLRPKIGMDARMCIAISDKVTEQYVIHALNQLGIEYTINPLRKGYFVKELRIRTSSIKRYTKVVGISLARKREKALEFLRFREGRFATNSRAKARSEAWKLWGR